MANSRLLIPITGLFVASLLIANTLDTKILMFFGLALPAGILLFPLAYVFGDVLTEVYGFAVSRRIIWTGFASLVLMLVMYEIARAVPPAPFWPNQTAFDAIFSHVPRIVLASIVAYFCGEFVNSYVVAKLKVAQAGKAMWLRFLASTVVGQAVDTAVFVLIAFGGTMAVSALVNITLSAWLVKVGWELVALPLTLVVVRYVKRIDGQDVFDVGTNFNPFRVS